MKKKIIVYVVLLILGLTGVVLGIVIPNSIVASKNTYTATSTTSLIEGKNYNVDIKLKDEEKVEFVRIKFNSNISLVSKDKNYTIDYPANELEIKGKEIHLNIVLEEATDIIKMGIIQKIWVVTTDGETKELENAEWKVPTIICVSGASGILSAVSTILLIMLVSKTKKKELLINSLSEQFVDFEGKNMSIQDMIDLKKGIDAKEYEDDYYDNKNQMLKIVQKYNLKKKD